MPHISIVEMMILNPAATETWKGFRYYRLEYFLSDGPYADHECAVFLPSYFDVSKLEDELNSLFAQQADPKVCPF